MAMKADRPTRYASTALALALGLTLGGCNRSTPEDTAAATSSTMAPAPDAMPPATPGTSAMPADTMAPEPASTAAMPAGAATAGMPPVAAAVLNAADKAFLTKVGKSNEEEIATTELGMQQGGAKAKELSQMLNTDHVGLRTTVAALAPDMPAPSPGKAPASLSGMKSTAFDSRLFATYVDQHQAAIKDFTAASKDMALGEPVRSLAAQTLPTLQHHLDAAKDAQRAK